MFTQIKQKLATYPTVDYNQLWDQLTDVDVVSFDVFNTLLKQNTPANADIFTLVATIWEQQHGTCLTNFKSLRQTAEKHARSKYAQQLTLTKIYDFLTVPSEVMQLEIQLRFELQQANAPLQDLYNALKQLGKRIVVIADTMLDAQTVVSMLAQAGYTGYEKLYVTQTDGRPSKDTILFKTMLTELAVAPNQVLHVGDDWQRDYLASRGAEIACFRLPKITLNSHQPLITNDVLLQTVQLFSNNMLAKYEFDGYQEFGYSVFGPVILGFSQWLARNVARDTKIFFFARDGFILQEAYQKLYPEQTTSYLYVSRRALQVPLLREIQPIADVLAQINLPREFTMYQFLKACGVQNADDTKQDLTKYTTAPIFHPQLEHIYQKYSCEITHNAQIEFEYLKQYLQAMGFNGQVAVVDIGWHGNKQQALQKFCQLAGIPVEISGYYFGMAKTNPIANLITHGFWFDQGINPQQPNLARPINGILEFLFSAKHGTTIRYEKQNETIVPVLASYEFAGQHELTIQGQLLKTIRQAALQFVSDFATSSLNPLIQLPTKSAMTLFELHTFKPDSEFMRRFGHFIFIDRNVKYLVTPKSNWYYLRHPQQFKGDFLLSRWSIGF